MTHISEPSEKDSSSDDGGSSSSSGYYIYERPRSRESVCQERFLRAHLLGMEVSANLLGGWSRPNDPPRARRGRKPPAKPKSSWGGGWRSMTRRRKEEELERERKVEEPFRLEYDGEDTESPFYLKNGEWWWRTDLEKVGIGTTLWGIKLLAQ